MAKAPKNTSAFRSLEAKHAGDIHCESIDPPLQPEVKHPPKQFEPHADTAPPELSEPHADTAPPKLSEPHADTAPPKKSRTVSKSTNATNVTNNVQADHCGLLHFRKWWERIEVDISVYGTLISGTPIFVEDNTLRVINDRYSYFIPIEKIDYIRTTDGLKSSFHSSDRN